MKFTAIGSLIGMLIGYVIAYGLYMPTIEYEDQAMGMVLWGPVGMFFGGIAGGFMAWWLFNKLRR